MVPNQSKDGEPSSWGARKPYRTFGRRVGPGLSPRQKMLVSDELPAFLPPFARASQDWLDELKGGGVKRLILEIGFGGGEHLYHNASTDPDSHYIGAEPFLNGVVKLLDRALEDGARNITIHHGDVRDLLNWLPEGCLDRVDMLYPDPWPKSRHHKRRLFNRDFIARIVPRMKSDAPFRFASDIPGYVEWALAEAKASGQLVPETLDPDALARPYPGWPGTRYEQKAFREGRTPQYLTFRISESGTK